MESVEMRPIGVIRTAHEAAEGTPIQPSYAGEQRGEVHVDPAYADALEDIEGFDRVWLVYVFHRARPFEPLVVPYRDTQRHGLFATRAPSRPNPIGLSVVRLLGRRGAVLDVAGADMLDGTPLLDIKPYVPAFDVHTPSRAGWLDEGRTDRRAADGRFAAEGPHDDT